jgi:hypothetical protein
MSVNSELWATSRTRTQFAACAADKEGQKTGCFSVEELKIRRSSVGRVWPGADWQIWADIPKKQTFAADFCTG